jgi:hypothetical protein
VADRFSASFLTAAFERELRAKAASVARAAQWALRDAGRATQRAARRKVRVYKGPGAVSVASARKVWKSGGTVARSEVVAGLLRDSVRPSRRIIRAGPVLILRVGPRGPRAHLYAAKIDAEDHFMDAGREAGEARLGLAMVEALGRVWR